MCVVCVCSLLCTRAYVAIRVRRRACVCQSIRIDCSRASYKVYQSYCNSLRCSNTHILAVWQYPYGTRTVRQSIKCCTLAVVCVLLARDSWVLCLCLRTYTWDVTVYYLHGLYVPVLQDSASNCATWPLTSSSLPVIEWLGGVRMTFNAAQLMWRVYTGSWHTGSCCAAIASLVISTVVTLTEW
jgi:hypothetical protein